VWRDFNGTRCPGGDSPRSIRSRRPRPGSGGALVVATHDPEVAARCDRILDLHAA
jgi:hypothetical protein